MIFVLIVALFFAWTYIHEMSHVWMAEYLVGLKSYKLKLYPHKDPKYGFRWAVVTYKPKREITPREDALISLAPRIPGVLACIMAPAFMLFLSADIFAAGIGLSPVTDAGIEFWWTVAVFWLAFWGAGIVDFLYGSLGISKDSDLQRAAKGLEISPWPLRALSFLTLPTLLLAANVAVIASVFLLVGL